MAITAGTLYPGTVTTAAVAPYNGLNWTTPLNVRADDTSYTSITASTFDLGVTSYMLYATNYGATVPADGTITGVVVEIGKYYSIAPARDGVVQLYNGSAIGNNLGSTSTNWNQTAIATVSYGGTANLWGATLTPAIVNGTTFGVQFAATAAGNNCDAYVDFIRLVIWYEPAAVSWNITPAEASQARVNDPVSLFALYSLTAAENTQARVVDAVGASFNELLYAPTTGVLDSFNRADENPLAVGSWGNPFAAGQGAWKISGNRAVPV